MIRLSVTPTPEGAALAAAERVAAAIADAQFSRGIAHVSLAGGNTPRRAYELLTPRLADPSHVEWWFGDERCVSPDDPDSNYHLVAESLLAAGTIPLERIHRIRGENSPADAAAAYEDELRSQLPTGGNGIPTLDVSFLGLGEDGHTASLFPGDPALDVRDRLAVAVVAPKPPPNRITLTLPILQAARSVVMLATGVGKANAVQRMLAGPDPAVPASLLEPADVVLVVDEHAAP